MTDLKFYDINREGWIGISESLFGKNERLAWIDVKEGEYIVIDSDGWLYEPRRDEESRYGYRWKRSDRQNVDVQMMLLEHAHGEQLSEDELRFCR